MQSASPSDLICPNPSCQARNPVGQALCESCQTRLPVVVLYAPSLEDWAGPKGNQLVGDRYRWCGRGVLVDHKPGLVPDAPDEVPTAIAVYLRLFEHRPQVPIPYGQVQVDGRSRLLLEEAPVTLTGELRLPDIRQEWSQATTLRQLNWLWQIASLWDPLQRLQCESTLLDAQKIRVEGGWIRLLSLDYQPSKRPLKAAELVREWLAWSSKSRKPLKQGLTRLLGQLMEEGHSSGSAIAQVLKSWIIEWSAAQKPCQSIVAAFTDPGPSRDRNEDACFPFSNSGITAPNDRTLAVVCDGLGGHDSGEVASMLAIETFETQLGQQLEHTPGPPSDLPGHSTRKTYIDTLLQSFLSANHQISAQNDKESREERQRMGTTAVVTLQEGRLLYSASLGDSRIYRLTAQSCHQITTDDDLASREVRLGYGYYRDISQAPTGGALVQALGMGSSDYLSPGIRPLILDEDCIFLLCSDGVSDFDFVERYWRDIYGYINQGQSLEQVAQNIVRLANQVNGHDNATAALVSVQGKVDRETDVPLTLPAAIAPPSGTTNLTNPFVETA
ncbi:MAG: PP2C family protein-serine/threonine phosphatase, partial [Cyanophyceae cyanobacterium]